LPGANALAYFVFLVPDTEEIFNDIVVSSDEGRPSFFAVQIGADKTSSEELTSNFVRNEIVKINFDDDAR
jgi:hypothetical protein